jgi:hypothetical protein
MQITINSHRIRHQPYARGRVRPAFLPSVVESGATAEQRTSAHASARYRHRREAMVQMVRFRR